MLEHMLQGVLGVEYGLQRIVVRPEPCLTRLGQLLWWGALQYSGKIMPVKSAQVEVRLNMPGLKCKDLQVS